jgi:hypothetical protein
LPRRAKLE